MKLFSVKVYEQRVHNFQLWKADGENRYLGPRCHTQVIVRFLKYCIILIGTGDGYHYFRLFGKGLHLKDRERKGLLFSERNRLGNFGFYIGRYYLSFLN
jgi:hypothetical protein